MFLGILLIGLILVALIALSQVIIGLRELWAYLKDYIKDRKKNK